MWGSLWSPVLMGLCMAVCADEEGAQLEEEEEEEESGSLDEEGMKKMQSDEVCVGSPEALLPPPLQSPQEGCGARCVGSGLSPSPASSLLPRAQRAWR